jgi:hypothetical protein
MFFSGLGHQGRQQVFDKPEGLGIPHNRNQPEIWNYEFPVLSLNGIATHVAIGILVPQIVSQTRGQGSGPDARCRSMAAHYSVSASERNWKN